MDNIIVIGILILVIGLAGLYVYKAKKKGKKCIGCPGSCGCSDEQKAACGCNISDE